MKDKITKRSSIRFSIIERINYYFSDPLKKHNNSIESVKETEKQSKETAPLSDFQSSYRGDNSPPYRRRKAIFSTASETLAVYFYACGSSSSKATAFSELRLRRLDKDIKIFKPYKNPQKFSFAESEERGEKTKKQTQFVLSKQSSFRACDAYR